MSPTSAGMTASLPYASQNGVSPISLLAVVWYAHKTLGSSSGQMPFAPLSRVLMILSKDRFVTFTCPLACRWTGNELWFSIPSSEQKSLNALLSNYFSLSETSTLGIPYLQMMFFQTKFRIFFSMIVAKALASTHLVK